MGLSIRWRLTLWIGLALTIVLGVFAALVFGLLHHALVEQTDRLLDTALGQLPKDPQIESATDARLAHWVEEYQDHQNFQCAIYRSGELHAKTPSLATESIAAIQPHTADSWVQTVVLPVIGRQRIMAQRMRLGGREFLVILLAPLAEVDQELAEVRTVLFIAGPIALLLAGSLSYWLAGRVLTPIDQLRQSADAITADSLHERLSCSHPHDEIGQLTRTINGMIVRLERSFTEIRRFTADASHELRTPLTAMRATVEVALTKSLTPTEHQQLLGNVLEELVRMSRLTDQLLTLSRRDAGVENLVLVPVDLPALVADVVEALRPMAEAKRQELHLYKQGSAQVAGDEGRLRQVVINLIDNAVKYTLEGGRVQVSIERQAETVCMTVADSGIGIAPEHLPHVFERFFRVDKARGRADGGTGLGLSIAQSIVNAHGGTIAMTSTIGHGTACVVALPVEPENVRNS